MAKSEQRAISGPDASSVSDEFDLEALLSEDLATLPEEQKISGAWIVKWISAFVNHGTGDKGPWVMVTINFDPQYPFGDDADQTAEELDMEDLPKQRHRMFYSTNADKRLFRDLAAKFGVEAGTLNDMLKDARGHEAVVTIKNGTDKRGMPETKLSNFRMLPDETPPV
jgi:hypothetical protein